ncbi:MAG: ribosomal-processing cysteine protease Prp [Dorea sp.]
MGAENDKHHGRKNGDRHILHIEGHAGYGTYGNDIVCAAVSILGYTWINELLILKERKTGK